MLLSELPVLSLIIAWVVMLMMIGATFATRWMNADATADYSQYLNRTQWVGVTASFVWLIQAFIRNDFSYLYVANHSNTHLPLLYRIGATWGAHEGSMLLWLWILSTWSAVIGMRCRSLAAQTRLQLNMVMACLMSGFTWFVLATSNPFARTLVQVPKQGRDLNALLQDPGLMGHPPILYTGYVGFAVAFAFAAVTLWQGRLDRGLLARMRPLVVIAWSALTLGITLGSWWAYRVLGWGGWWFWDPVENASLLPWLAGTALLHSMIVTGRSGRFVNWTLFLALVTFCLSILGTFLVRSGVLLSVHAFANDPKRGLFMLIYFFLVTGAGLLLFALRSQCFETRTKSNRFSREALLLSNNLLLFVSMLIVLLGTIYPLLADAFFAQKVSVGAPYFNMLMMPIGCALLTVMAMVAYRGWHDTHQVLPKTAWGLLAGALLFTIAVRFGVATGLTVALMIVCALALWLIASTLLAWLKEPRTERLRAVAMLFAHVGVAVCVLGIALTSALSDERYVSMSPGDKTPLTGYEFEFARMHTVHGNNYTGLAADFRIWRGDKLIAEKATEKHTFPAQKMTTTIPAIVKGWTRDLYIALGERGDSEQWTVRIYNKPFVRWIWFGGILMMLGGLLSVISKTFNQFGRKGAQHAH